MKKNNTKKAMSLLSILAMMIVVMVAIIVSTPIITKKLTDINNTKGDDGIKNNAKGYFLCYIDHNKNLQQIRADINGDTTNITGPRNAVNGCTFDLPQNSEAYKVTLIGGGGGGAGTKAETTTAIFAKDSIDFGTNKVVLNAFQDYKKYFSQADVWTGIKGLFNAKYTSISIYIKGARPDAQDGKVGGDGAICGFKLDDLISDISSATTITYSSGQTGTTEDTIYKVKKGYDGTITATITITPGRTADVKTYYARGGGAPIYWRETRENASWKTYKECYNSLDCKIENKLEYINYINNLGNGMCDKNNKTTPTSSESTASMAGDAPYAKNTYLNQTIKQIPLTLEYKTIKGTIAHTGGTAGNTSTHQLAFLTNNNNVKQIKIPRSSIGEGGAGGNCDTSCNGSNGGDTTLTLNLLSGPVTYTAKGGAGGTTTTKTLDYTEVGTVYNADGIDGTIISYGIPAAFTSKIGVGGGKGPIYDASNKSQNCDYTKDSYGRGKTLSNYKTEAYYNNTYCNGSPGINAGSGGGSAALAFRLYSGYSLQLKSSLSSAFAYPAIDTVIQQYLNGNGGNGAGGAILIEW